MVNFVSGFLYLVATPIGNLEDITLRAIRTLGEVDLILCEDTRQTRRLLDHYRISKPLESFFEHNELPKIPKTINILEGGKSVALVTDGGVPTVSDPGYRMVKAAIEKGIKVIPIPGASAVTTALAVSGLPTDQFVFVGFLPQKEGKRENFLKEVKPNRGTVVAYESPMRLVFCLKSIEKIFGDIDICVAREMTKIHEEFFRGKVSQAIKYFGEKPVKGEVTLVFHN